VTTAETLRTYIEWAPSQTAPKDGRRVLLFIPDYKEPIQIGYYQKSETFAHGKLTHSLECWRAGPSLYWNDFPEPTHWAPLPFPPKKKKRAP
jgi:hypothetical protein